VNPSEEPLPLQQYGYNLTHIAREGRIPPLRGYEAAVARLFDILLRWGDSRKKCNPLLLHVDEKRRWQVVMEAVRRMAAGEAPEPLPTREVIALNFEALFARVPASLSHQQVARSELLVDESEWELAQGDTGSEETVEQVFAKYFPKGLWPPLQDWDPPNEILARLHRLFLAVRQSQGRVLLFVNHFHQLLGGEPQRFSIDAAPLFKPVLARREIQLIAGCTPEQYRRYIERDAAIARRLQQYEILPDEELSQSPPPSLRRKEEDV